ncbi:MAG: maleylpyruvate isomerase N-terminal domain-containing protein [Dehalococcoidia bacterium]|nr:hypothetical protein [Chloroflexi bacterium CFX7]MCK6564719.1 maleylpyruvate isomerase N-terminal domain-containing protein [Dehalococcoidia bacterium]NUQ54383.1 maleylpyruvate isomerase N-terminal domain-containing protein [Dehalococcoidia bacterium]RIL04333.1 MAG: hypothetical protein DCC78_01800 [bacterium]
MLARVHALADKLIYDVAMARYLAATLPKNGLERKIPGGWTVRQLIGHLGDAQARYAAALANVLAGEPPFPGGFDPERQNSAAAPAFASARLPALLESLDQTRSSLLDLMGSFSPAQLEMPFSHGLSLIEALGAWSGHIEGHALDVIDAVPELGRDPMVLNWVLYADYTADPGRLVRQQRLLEAVREHFGEDAPGAGDEDFEDEEES